MINQPQFKYIKWTGDNELLTPEVLECLTELDNGIAATVEATMSDLMTYGTAIIKDGKRVDPRTVKLDKGDER